MVQKGTYTEFLKSGVDFGSLLKRENEEADQSPALGSPALRTRSFSASSVWSQQSSRPSLKDGVPEAQAVSCPLATCRVLSAVGVLVHLRSAALTIASEWILRFLGLGRIKTQ